LIVTGVQTCALPIFVVGCRARDAASVPRKDSIVLALRDSLAAAAIDSTAAAIIRAYESGEISLDSATRHLADIFEPTGGLAVSGDRKSVVRERVAIP